jgi:hypothetical protein
LLEEQNHEPSNDYSVSAAASMMKSFNSAANSSRVGISKTGDVPHSLVIVLVERLETFGRAVATRNVGHFIGG